MYWYVKLILYLILLVLVLGIGNCAYRMIAPRLVDDEEAAEDELEERREPVDEDTDIRRPSRSPREDAREPELSGETRKVLDDAGAQLEAGNLHAALNLARRVLNVEAPVKFSPAWRKAAEIVSKVNTELINSDIPAPEKERYTVQSGDSLARIANKFGTTVEAIQRMNNIDPADSLIYPGMTLFLYIGDWSILVSKDNFLLVLYDGDELFKVYDVGIGRQDRTPVGTFVIHNKLREPDWTPPGKVIPYGDPDNVLGTRWLGVTPVGDTDPALTGYGIHGTWEPETVGTAASQGCIRMENEDVNELYDLIPRPPSNTERLREEPERGVMVTIIEE